MFRPKGKGNSLELETSMTVIFNRFVRPWDPNKLSNMVCSVSPSNPLNVSSSNNISDLENNARASVYCC